MNRDRLKKNLKLHEGVRSKPYRCTAGKLTIGVGRNLDDKGLSTREIEFLLSNDIDECIADLQDIFAGQFDQLPDHVQEVLAEMRFQLGPGGFWKFKRLRSAIKAWDFDKAADEMLDSKWARVDTPRRARGLAEVMRHGYKSDA